MLTQMYTMLCVNYISISWQKKNNKKNYINLYCLQPCRELFPSHKEVMKSYFTYFMKCYFIFSNLMGKN